MSTPRFSVVIPTYQRAEPLRATLDALSALQVPPDGFEVIVVDDGGGGDLDAALAPFRAALDLSLLREPHRGPAAARNAGAGAARGQYLVFTDDDCRPAADWLCAIDACVTPECAVGGPCVNALAGDIYAAATGALLDYLFAYYNRDPARARFLSTNNLAVPAARFHAVGGFALTFTHAAGEDREFCARWREHGYALRFAPQVVVYHAHALGSAAFWQQHVNYGRGAFHVHRLRTRRFEPLAFYFDLLRAPLAAGPSGRALRIAALLLVAQCANAAGLAAEYLHAWVRPARRKHPEALTRGTS